MKNILFITMLLFSWSYPQAQNTLKVKDGSLKVVGSSSMVLHNTQFINNGTFDAGTGTVILTGDGTDAESAIGGSSTTTFHNLQLNKTANGSQLGQAIQVDNELQMTAGNLDLNGNNLTLGAANGIIVDEKENSRITGAAGGEVSKTVDLNAPTAANPGNIGVIITSVEDLGATTISRGHVPELIGDNNSIQRYYIVTPTNNADLDAIAKFQYFDAELNGNAELDGNQNPILGPWRKDGDFWFNTPTSDVDVDANFVETQGVNQFSRWSLAPESAKLSLKAFLQGAYTTINGLMGDNLRELPDFPLTEPYSTGNGETIDPAVLNVTTNDAIVDWVLVELRDAVDPSVVVASRAALIQKDGDIVEVDGVSPVSFPRVGKGNSYYIAVKHRNHLGVMTANAVVLE